jgi:hypothetical protein
LWGLVEKLLRHPDKLRAGLEEMIERERAGSRGDPKREIAMWLDKAAEADRKRAGFQDMAAEGLITLEKLRAKLVGLEETRVAVEAEIEHLRGRMSRVEDLERPVSATRHVRGTDTRTATGTRPGAKTAGLRLAAHQIDRPTRRRTRGRRRPRGRKYSL